MSRAAIVRREDITADLFVVWLQPEVASFTFKPGQYITVGLEGIERPYSIVSAPYERLIELFVERVPVEHGGQLTPLLHARRVGDVVSIRPRAKGRFSLQSSARNHVMVATVTGVAPYVSIVRQFVHDYPAAIESGEWHRFFIVHGASYRDEFVYDRELRALSDRCPRSIHYVSTVSRPSDPRNAGWEGATGRVNLIIEECLTRWSLPTQGTVVYLCGNPGMIDDVNARLAPAGWSILTEQYWRSARVGRRVEDPPRR